MKYAIIGDLHGSELGDLEKALRLEDPDTLICLGDFDQVKTIHQFIDLEKRFNLVREKEVVGGQKHNIISEVEGNTFGVVVDQVREVLRVPVSSIKKAPSLVSVKINSDFVTGVVVLNEVEKSETQSASRRTKSETTKTESDKKITEEKEESRLIILIDLPKMLSEKELLELGSMAKKVQE